MLKWSWVRVFCVDLEELLFAFERDFLEVVGLGRGLWRLRGGKSGGVFSLEGDAGSNRGRFEGRVGAGVAGGEDERVDGGEDGCCTENLAVMRFREPYVRRELMVDEGEGQRRLAHC